MNLNSELEPGGTLFGPQRPSLEVLKDVAEDASRVASNPMELANLNSSETVKYQKLAKNQQKYLGLLAEKYPEPGLMAKPDGTEVKDRKFAGTVTAGDKLSYFSFPGTPMYWTTERSGKSKLGVTSPPASWWLQREAAQRFWEWLRPMGSSDRNGSVRGPKLQMLVNMTSMTGVGKWWPDMPTSESDLNRHRGWYASKWVMDTQPSKLGKSEFLEIERTTGAPDRSSSSGEEYVRDRADYSRDTSRNLPQRHRHRIRSTTSTFLDTSSGIDGLTATIEGSTSSARPCTTGFYAGVVVGTGPATSSSSSFSHKNCLHARACSTSAHRGNYNVSHHLEEQQQQHYRDINHRHVKPTTSFGIFFKNRDNTAHPAVGEVSPSYLKPAIPWVTRDQNGVNSEQHDPESREGEVQSYERDFRKYRDPCKSGVRQALTPECAVAGTLKQVKGGTEPTLEQNGDEKSETTVKKQEQKKRGLIMRALGGIANMLKSTAKKDPPITQADFFRRYSMRRGRQFEPTNPVLDEEVYTTYADEWKKKAGEGIPLDKKQVGKTVNSKMKMVKDIAQKTINDTVGVVKGLMGMYEPSRDYNEDVTPPIEEPLQDPGRIDRVDNEYQNVIMSTAKDQMYKDGYPIPNGVTLDPDLFNKIDINPNGEVSGKSMLPRDVPHLVASRWQPYGHPMQVVNNMMSFPPGPGPGKMEPKPAEGGADAEPAPTSLNAGGAAAGADAADAGEMNSHGGYESLPAVTQECGPRPTPAEGTTGETAGETGDSPGTHDPVLDEWNKCAKREFKREKLMTERKHLKCGNPPPEAGYKLEEPAYEKCAKEAGDEASQEFYDQELERDVTEKAEAENKALLEMQKSEELYGNLKPPDEEEVEEQLAHLENEITGGPEFSLPLKRISEEKKYEIAMRRATQKNALQRLLPDHVMTPTAKGEIQLHPPPIKPGFEQDAILAQRRDALVMDDKYLRDSHIQDDENELGNIAKKMSHTVAGDDDTFVMEGIDDRKAKKPKIDAGSSEDNDGNSIKDHSKRTSTSSSTTSDEDGAAEKKEEADSWTSFWNKVGFEQGEQQMKRLWEQWKPYQEPETVSEVEKDIHWPRTNSFDAIREDGGSILLNKYRKRLERQVGAVRPGYKKWKLSEIL
ncbi:unnamed protein product [Amoebophrya sp. A120]|nr:unnamed protein product [Amoebophrya sp. A120]|eukprot:GSA120T00008066001.1